MLGSTRGRSPGRAASMLGTLPARSRAGWGCGTCCGIPVPRWLTSEQWSIVRGSQMQGYEHCDPSSAQAETGVGKGGLPCSALAVCASPIRCRDQMGFCRLRGVKRL